MFFKIGALKNFTSYTGKHLCWSLILVKLQAWFAATLLKRDSNTGVFPWNFQNFLYRIPPVATSAFSRSINCELNWYVETLAQVFFYEFCKVFKNIINHLRWLLISVTRCKTSKYTMTSTCSEFIVWW